MKLTRQQLESLAVEIEAGAEVPFEVRVTLADPAAAALRRRPPGARDVLVRLSDRWGVDHLRIGAGGLVTRPSPTDRRPPA